MNPDRVAILEMELSHQRSLAYFYEKMARASSEALWEIILTLNLPPEREPELPVLFGSWSASRVLDAVRDAVQGPRTAEAVPEGLAPADEGRGPREVPVAAGQGERAPGSNPERDLDPTAARSQADHESGLQADHDSGFHSGGTWYADCPGCKLAAWHAALPEFKRAPLVVGRPAYNPAFDMVAQDHALGRHVLPDSSCVYCVRVAALRPGEAITEARLSQALGLAQDDNATFTGANGSRGGSPD